MRSQSFETIIGAIVLLVVVLFTWTTYRTVNRNMTDTYQLKANFTASDGLSEGAQVDVNGVKVGTVRRIKLNPKNYLAEVTFEVSKNIALPSDSRASILSSGLLGNKFLAIIPGSSETFLKPNEYIEETDPPINLETLLGKFVFSTSK